MNISYKIYNTIRKWEEAGRPVNCYIEENIAFKIVCKKCKGTAVLYELNQGQYAISHTINCQYCGNEEEIYGTDG